MIYQHARRAFDTRNTLCAPRMYSRPRALIVPSLHSTEMSTLVVFNCTVRYVKINPIVFNLFTRPTYSVCRRRRRRRRRNKTNKSVKIRSFDRPPHRIIVPSSKNFTSFPSLHKSLSLQHLDTNVSVFSLHRTGLFDSESGGICESLAKHLD